MTPANLAIAGLALYGPRWQAEMARALGVSRRTVVRWVAGEYAIPNRTADKLTELLAARRLELTRMVMMS